jgi:hypothetical protein
MVEFWGGLSMSKDTFYFSHDYNTRNDQKIKKLMSKHGYLGYGIFWAIVEDLYNNANALHLDYDSIAFDLRTTTELVESIINDFELFVINGDTFGSLSIQKRLDERDLKSKKARESARYRWDKENDNANALQPESDANAIKESKGKESKGKDIIKEASIEAANKLKDLFNAEHGTQTRIVSEKTVRQLKAFIEAGYRVENVIEASKELKKEKWLAERNFKELNIEFITRPDKMEKYYNQVTASIPKQNMGANEYLDNFLKGLNK